jgi:hypothetical protein
MISPGLVKRQKTIGHPKPQTEGKDLFEDI